MPLTSKAHLKINASDISELEIENDPPSPFSILTHSLSDPVEPTKALKKLYLSRSLGVHQQLCSIDSSSDSHENLSYGSESDERLSDFSTDDSDLIEVNLPKTVEEATKNLPIIDAVEDQCHTISMTREIGIETDPFGLGSCADLLEVNFSSTVAESINNHTDKHQALLQSFEETSEIKNSQQECNATQLPKVVNDDEIDTKRLTLERDLKQDVTTLADACETKRILLHKNKPGSQFCLEIDFGTKPLNSTMKTGVIIKNLCQDTSYTQQLLDVIHPGDEILEWNEFKFENFTHGEIRKIIENTTGEVELLVRMISKPFQANIKDNISLDKDCSFINKSKSAERNTENERCSSTKRRSKSHSVLKLFRRKSSQDSLNLSQIAKKSGAKLSSEMRCNVKDDDQFMNKWLSVNSQEQKRGSCKSDLRRCSGKSDETTSDCLSFVSVSEPVRQHSFDDISLDIRPRSKSSCKLTTLAAEELSVVQKFRMRRCGTHVERRKKSERGYIQLQLSHSKSKEELQVKVLKARNLMPRDSNGLSDPFVKIYLLPGRDKENKRKTSYIAKTLNPVWNQVLTYPNIHFDELQYKTLEITIWDYDRLKTNDFIGKFVIELSHTELIDGIPRWYQLKSSDFTNFAAVAIKNSMEP